MPYNVPQQCAVSVFTEQTMKLELSKYRTYLDLRGLVRV